MYRVCVVLDWIQASRITLQRLDERLRDFQGQLSSQAFHADLVWQVKERKSGSGGHVIAKKKKKEQQHALAQS